MEKHSSWNEFIPGEFLGESIASNNCSLKKLHGEWSGYIGSATNPDLFWSNTEIDRELVSSSTGFMLGASTGFMFASGGGLSEGYGHDGSGVGLGNSQTEDEGVLSQGGRGDALLRRMPPYLTYLPSKSQLATLLTERSYMPGRRPVHWLRCVLALITNYKAI